MIRMKLRKIFKIPIYLDNMLSSPCLDSFTEQGRFLTKVVYINRESGDLEEEKIYGKIFLDAFYGNSMLSKVLFLLVLPVVTHVSLFSKLYGKIQKSPKSCAKIRPFIKKFGVDISEIATPIDSFRSFNDFFIRKLKHQARPIAEGDHVAILPADGRYLVYPKINLIERFYVKNKKFDLRRLLLDKDLFDLYECGSMVIVRLSPTDCHRFHFPCRCLPSEPESIAGPLFSVNPIALKRQIYALSENKRMITQLQTDRFGNILYIEVGATFVGTIKQTYTPHLSYNKGEEKGYFEFGGSCLILLFQPDSITLDQDLIDNSLKHIETKAKFGMSLGRCK